LKSIVCDRTLVSHHLTSREITETFMDYDPFTKESITSCYSNMQNNNHYDRPELASGFLAYNRKIGSDALALANCEKLKNSDVAVVVTGQQAGMLTGPIYTIYKIVTAINLARRIESDFNIPAIPIFWNATEDHDLSEIEAFEYPGTRWKAEFPKDGIAAQFLQVKPGCKRLIDDFLQSIPAINHNEEITAVLSGKYDNYGEWSSSIIATLFQGTGLVVMEPYLLRPWSRSFFQHCLTSRAQITEALAESAAQLQPHQVEPAFAPENGETGLFYINENGQRRGIREADHTYQIDGKWINEDGVTALIKQTPERFSTGAFVRPVLQSLKIPTLVYVAGPSEYTYHLQLRSVFKLFNVAMPVIFPRNHATVLTKKEAKIAEQLELKIDDYFKGPAPFYNASSLPAQEAQAFVDASLRFEAAVDDLYRETSELVSKKQIDRFRAVVNSKLLDFEKKITKEHLRHGGVGNARVDRFFNCIFPGNTAQERRINVFYFIERNGLEFISDLLAAMDPFETRHYIFYADN